MGEPRQRPQVLATREMAVNELRDHGYPYAATTVEESQEPGVRDVGDHVHRRTGPLSVFGRIEVSGNTSISEEVIRRELQYEAGRALPSKPRAGESTETQRLRDSFNSSTSRS